MISPNLRQDCTNCYWGKYIPSERRYTCTCPKKCVKRNQWKEKAPIIIGRPEPIKPIFQTKSNKENEKNG